MRTLVWFRGKDLRVADHDALSDAAVAGEVIPLFVVDPYFFEHASDLPHRMQFLVESLASLEANIRHLGSELVFAKGKSVDVVPRLAQKWKVDRVVAYRWTEPFARKRDERVAAALHVPFVLYEGETLAKPGSLRTATGTPYSVYTPFSRAFRRDVRIPATRPTPKSLPPLPKGVARELDAPTIESLGLVKNPRILPGGERAGRERLRAFLQRGEGYAEGRDRMDEEKTSRLSADLKFGTLSIRTVWNESMRALADRAPADLEKFQNELLWREFSHSLLWERPELLEHPFRREFEGFPWENDETLWRSWVRGETGYPVVDAAARQLLTEGYVHNRARMVTASFLTKHLLIDYRRGEAHYMKWLTDGDWAQNNAGWQWSAGCGCDAQPYFRVFNPVAQGERFDPEGNYVRTWLPALAKLPARHIHKPWEAPADVLLRAGVKLGRDYAEPVVDHAEARSRFLALAETHLAGKKVQHASV